MGYGFVASWTSEANTTVELTLRDIQTTAAKLLANSMSSADPNGPSAQGMAPPPFAARRATVRKSSRRR